MLYLLVVILSIRNKLGHFYMSVPYSITTSFLNNFTVLLFLVFVNSDYLVSMYVRNCARTNRHSSG